MYIYLNRAIFVVLIALRSRAAAFGSCPGSARNLPDSLRLLPSANSRKRKEKTVALASAVGQEILIMKYLFL